MFFIKAEEKEQSQRDSSWVKLSLLLIFVLIGLALFRIWGWYRCVKNQEELRMSLEMYIAHGAHDYPPRLEILESEDFINIPKCPLAFKETYSSNYEAKILSYQLTFFCSNCNNNFGFGTSKRIITADNVVIDSFLTTDEAIVYHKIDTFMVKIWKPGWNELSKSFKRIFGWGK